MSYAFQVDTGGTLLTGLEAYYKLDETSGNRVDVSVNGRDMTDNNTVGATTGKVNGAAAFLTANSEYLSRASFLDNPTNMSAAFWVKSATDATYAFITKSNDVVNNDDAGWAIYASSVNNFARAFFVTDVSNNLKYQGATSLIDDAWHFVVVSKSGTTITIYVDNGTDEAVDAGSAGTLGSTSNAHAVVIGAQAVPNLYFNGALDEIGLWSKALSAQERTDLYNAGNGQTMVQAGAAVVSGSNLLTLKA